MTVYVEIPRLNGRMEFYELADKLNQKGFDDSVEYCEGGWEDMEMGTVKSHLKFEDEKDATAYVLSYGGKITKKIPVRED